MNVKIYTTQNGTFNRVENSKQIDYKLHNELEVHFESKEDLGEDYDLIFLQADTCDNRGNDLLCIPLTRNEANLLAKTLLTMLECTTE